MKSLFVLQLLLFGITSSYIYVTLACRAQSILDRQLTEETGPKLLEDIAGWVQASLDELPRPLLDDRRVPLLAYRDRIWLTLAQWARKRHEPGTALGYLIQIETFGSPEHAAVARAIETMLPWEELANARSLFDERDATASADSTKDADRPSMVRRVNKTREAKYRLQLIASTWPNSPRAIEAAHELHAAIDNTMFREFLNDVDPALNVADWKQVSKQLRSVDIDIHPRVETWVTAQIAAYVQKRAAARDYIHLYDALLGFESDPALAGTMATLRTAIERDHLHLSSNNCPVYRTTATDTVPEATKLPEDRQARICLANDTTSPLLIVISGPATPLNDKKKPFDYEKTIRPSAHAVNLPVPAGRYLVFTTSAVNLSQSLAIVDLPNRGAYSPPVTPVISTAENGPLRSE